MSYTKNDLKEHKRLLAELASREHINTDSRDDDAKLLKLLKELRTRLTQLTLDAILQPSTDNDCASFINELQVTFSGLNAKNSHRLHWLLMPEWGYIDGLGDILALDPLQHLPVTTRDLVKSNRSVFGAIILLCAKDGCMNSTDMARHLFPGNHNRGALGKASNTLHLLQKHDLATRTKRKGKTFYTITELGRLLFDRNAL